MSSVLLPVLALLKTDFPGNSLCQLCCFCFVFLILQHVDIISLIKALQITGMVIVGQFLPSE